MDWPLIKGRGGGTEREKGVQSKVLPLRKLKEKWACGKVLAMLNGG